MTGATNRLLRGSDPGFPGELKRLKDRGCTMLVTGDLPESAFRTLAHKQFGEPDHETPRVRAFVRFEETNLPASHWFPERTKDRNHVVDVGNFARESAAAVPDPSTRPAEPPADDRFDRAIEAVSEIASDVEAFDAGQFRVTTWSLDRDADPGRVRSFACDLGELVVRHDGMAAFHCPTPHDHAIEHYGDVVDIIIKLRWDTSGHFPEQHWEIDADDREPTLSTGWHPLDFDGA